MLPKLKKGVLLVNAARGGIYDEAALLKGLESGQIGGVALDVFVEEPPPKEMPLVQHERVLVTPHLGASTKEAQARVALEIAEQVVAYLATGAITNAVNVPSVSSEMAPKLSPFVVLADRLGRFLAQVEHGVSPTAIEVECVGEPAELARVPLATPGGGPSRPRGVAMTPDGRYAVITGAARGASGSGVVWVMDVPARRVVGRLWDFFLAIPPAVSYR
jgi:D-3-phosphoglycerate dehydrogenase